MNIAFKRKRILFTTVLAVGLLAGLIIFQGPAKNLFLTVSSPLSRVLWQGGGKSAGFLDGLFHFQNIKQENKKLLDENLALKQQIVDLVIIKEENQELKKALELGLGQDFSLELVKVIAKEPHKDTILIKPTAKGLLERGMAVITGEKVLVGVIEQVSPGFAQVNLITAKGFSFDVELAGSILALAQGEGGLKLAFRDAQKESEIEEGYVAATANLSGKFPRGLLVGQVSEVSQSAAEPFQTGLLHPYFMEQTFNTLLVITDF